MSYVDMNRTFYGCQNLSCSDFDKLANILWKNPSLHFIPADSSGNTYTFRNCPIAKNAPFILGGTKKELDPISIMDDYLSKTNGGVISNDVLINGSLCVTGNLSSNGVDINQDISDIKNNISNIDTTFQNNYVSKINDSTISANISLLGNISVENGYIINGTNNNYLSSATGNIIIGNDNKLYGSNSSIHGYNCMAGCLGFKIINIDKENLLISCDTKNVDIPTDALSTEFTVITTTSAGNTSKILNIEKQDTVTKLQISEWYTAMERYADSNSPVYLVLLKFPSIGDVVTASWSHAEGYNSRVIGPVGHAEGYNTTAGKYGHSEGNATCTSWAGHAEGHGAQATQVAAHAEGRWTIADAYMSHAEGWGSQALGHASHASGLKSKALPDDYASFVW
jgi:hypothetical protein